MGGIVCDGQARYGWLFPTPFGAGEVTTRPGGYTSIESQPSKAMFVFARAPAGTWHLLPDCRIFRKHIEWEKGSSGLGASVRFRRSPEFHTFLMTVSAKDSVSDAGDRGTRPRRAAIVHIITGAGRPQGASRPADSGHTPLPASIVAPGRRSSRTPRRPPFSGPTNPRARGYLRVEKKFPIISLPPRRFPVTQWLILGASIILRSLMSEVVGVERVLPSRETLKALPRTPAGSRLTVDVGLCSESVTFS
jgi:hypothetical protein